MIDVKITSLAVIEVRTDLGLLKSPFLREQLLFDVFDIFLSLSLFIPCVYLT